MGTSTRLHSKCEKCPRKDNCNEKRMVMCAYVEPSAASMMPSLTPNMIPRITRETIVIHTGDNALGRVSVYKDDIEEQIRKSLMKDLCLNFRL